MKEKMIIEIEREYKERAPHLPEKEIKPKNKYKRKKKYDIDYRYYEEGEDECTRI